ncbi:predicted protein [Streptomyces viridosporus ATCC 14672]|uniref:Predicted protein n=1 Tax=Streptomyces viridosporus (strain ATCC 14672 / DSM 40746 / JCM 4963 / KCTC 9882 / NRRL B-12104 / FH 1290) TaxID=566461 RepID=D6AAJ3_STRV1|nr:predicted protein [Streptomyces viridosporus ATCC 14672]
MNGAPLLAFRGAGDEIFGPDGARAFARDLPDAKTHLVGFWRRTLPPRKPPGTVTGHTCGSLTVTEAPA